MQYDFDSLAEGKARAACDEGHVPGGLQKAAAGAVASTVLHCIAFRFSEEKVGLQVDENKVLVVGLVSTADQPSPS